MADSVIQLRCSVKVCWLVIYLLPATETPADSSQNDPWGKHGSQSRAAHYWTQTPGNGKLDENKTYSEVRYRYRSNVLV